MKFSAPLQTCWRFQTNAASGSNSQRLLSQSGPHPRWLVFHWWTSFLENRNCPPSCDAEQCEIANESDYGLCRPYRCFGLHFLSTVAQGSIQGGCHGQRGVSPPSRGSGPTLGVPRIPPPKVKVFLPHRKFLAILTVFVFGRVVPKVAFRVFWVFFLAAQSFPGCEPDPPEGR